MDKSVESLSVLFDKIYSAFIMRDVAGKIVPGIVLIMPVVLFFTTDSKALLDLLLNLNFGLWLFIVIALWILGYAVQSFGELTGLISYSLSDKKDDEISPDKYIWSYFKKYHIVSVEKMLHTQNEAHKKENNEANLKYIERLAIVREACGNTGVGLLLSSPMYIYYFYQHKIALTTMIPILIPLFVLMILLLRMHREHSHRYWHTLSHIANQDK